MYRSWSFLITIIFSCLLIITTVASDVVMMTHNEVGSSITIHEDFISTANVESSDDQYRRIVISPSSIRKRHNTSHSLLMNNTNATSSTRMTIENQSELQHHQQRNHRQEQTLVCNGLSKLCDKRVNEIMFGTPHNANAALMNGYKILPNHIQTLEKAIKSGYRSINIDMAKCFENKNSLQLIHGLCVLDKRSPYHVFNHINNFLIHNPNEVIVIVIEIDFQRNIRFPLSDIYAILQTIPGLTERMYSHPDRFNPFTSNRTSWPTLRELIQLDQRIILFTYNGESCYLNPTIICPIGFHDWFTYSGETQFELPKLGSIRNVSYSCEITRGQNGRLDFIAMNHFLQIPRIGVTTHQLNQYSFLKQRINDCSAFNNNRTINMIIVDFWDKGNVLQAVNDFNSEL